MTLPPVMPIPGSEPTEPITTMEPHDIPQPRRSPEWPRFLWFCNPSFVSWSRDLRRFGRRAPWKTFRHGARRQWRRRICQDSPRRWKWLAPFEVYRVWRWTQNDRAWVRNDHLYSHTHIPHPHHDFVVISQPWTLHREEAAHN